MRGEINHETKKPRNLSPSRCPGVYGEISHETMKPWFRFPICNKTCLPRDTTGIITVGFDHTLKILCYFLSFVFQGNRARSLCWSEGWDLLPVGPLLEHHHTGLVLLSIRLCLRIGAGYIEYIDRSLWAV